MKWIRAMEGRSHLEIIKHSSPLLLRALETAVRLGRPLLVEQCGETMNPVLEPVLASHRSHNAVLVCYVLYCHC